MKEGFKNIQLYLNEENIKFIEFMAIRDGMSFKDELRTIFFTELDHLKDLYEGDME